MEPVVLPSLLLREETLRGSRYLLLEENFT